jgi:hypothetical protein
MWIHQLPAPAVTGPLAQAGACVRAAAAVPTDALSVDELADGLSECALLESQTAALRLRLLAEADERRVAEALGHTGTDAWAARLTGTTRGVMAGGIWLARRLTETYHATREAFADGGVNEAQARAIVQAAETMPPGTGEDHRRAAEAALVEKAVNGMDARRLRQAARRMLEVVSAELADEHEATQLEDESRRAETETWMSLHDNGNGTFSGRFVIPELHGVMLRAALERLVAPSRHARNRAGEPVEDDTLPTDGPTLPWPERLGLAFTEVVEHLPTDGFGPVAATIIVTMTLEHLRDGLASAGLDGGARLSAGDARRMACEAGLVPGVLGGQSAPLDLGRSTRLHSRHQRRALRLVHDTCAAEGCERPFAWCDIHHRRWWSAGGATDLDNGVPLCGHHHRRAHDRRFTLESVANGDVRFLRRRWGDVEDR